MVSNGMRLSSRQRNLFDGKHPVVNDYGPLKQSLQEEID